MPPEIRRYRNNSEPAITVQNVSVGDGGKAIVGNVTQHASVIVSDNSGAPAVTAARRVPDARPFRTGARTCGRRAGSKGMSDHARNTAPMLASPRCGAKIRSGGLCRSPAVRGRKRCRMHGGAPGSGPPRGNHNARQHGPPGTRSPSEGRFRPWWAKRGSSCGR
jgi:hypothetical protein